MRKERKETMSTYKNSRTKAWLKGTMLSVALMMTSMATINVHAAEISEEVRTEELGEEALAVNLEDCSDYILQEGGLLDEEFTLTTDSPIMMLSLDYDSPNVKGAIETIVNACDNFATGFDISKYNIPASEYNALLISIMNTTPRLFYVDITKFFFYSSSNGYVTSTDISGYKYSVDVAKAMREKYESAVNEYMAGINPNWSDMEKALYLHDYIVDNCEYDLTYSNYDAYNVFVDKAAVCQGYSLAYKELMDRVGIPSQIVTSKAANHAWNLLYLNDQYYYVDTTWDDPTEDLVGRVNHKNFLRSYNDFKNTNHLRNGVQDWVITENWPYEVAEDTTWDNSFFNNVDAGCRYLNGYWYIKENAVISRYQYSNDAWNKLGKFYTINDIWYSSGGGYWPRTYSGLSMYNGLLYYATPTQVFSINPAVENSRVPVYTLTSAQQSQGDIYGMYVAGNGDVNIEIRPKSPNVDGEAIIVCNVAVSDPCANGHDFSVQVDGYYHGCSRCEALQIHDTNGVGNKCSECGYKHPVRLKDMSLELDPDNGAYIGVNLYLEATDDITICLDGNSLSRDSIFFSNTDIEGVYLYKIQYRCAAKELADNHLLTVYDYESDQVEIEDHGNAYKFSAKTYCDNVLKPDSTASDKLKKVCSALMEYNAQARNYFGYNTEGLEVGAVSGYIPNYSDNAMAITGQLPEGYAYLGSSLVLEDKLVLRHYFSGNFGGSMVSFGNLSGKGTDVTMNTVVMQESNLMYVDISAPYSCIDNMYRITIDLSDDINRSYSYTLKYGALTYYLKARDLNVGKDLINTCQALYNYSLATQNYFSN